jgi:hypothetical protein
MIIADFAVVPTYFFILGWYCAKSSSMVMRVSKTYPRRVKINVYF